MPFFQQIVSGGSIGPGATFPDNCYFENVTILATCTFGKGSIFKNCSFQKCCPKPNNNSPSKVVESIVENCSLESVSIDAKSLSINNKSTGYMVQDMGVKNPEGQARGVTEQSKLSWTLCETVEQACPTNGIVVHAPKEGSGKAVVNNTYNIDCENPCNVTLVVGPGTAQVKQE